MKKKEINMKREWVSKGKGWLTTLIATSVGGMWCVSAYAIPISVGADRVLGIIVPGTPANEANQRIMVNGLLDGWITKDGTVVLGYNQGAVSGTVMGDNPNDPQKEKYTLKFTATTLLPAPGVAPLARDNDWYKTETSDPIIDLGNYKYDWVLAKWGQDSEVYYIGDLTGTIQLNRVNFPEKGHGLSHYTLFNRTAVPDAGVTLALFGLSLLSLRWFSRGAR